MKIQTQNLIAVPPLFIILAVATGGLAYWTAQVEIHWGIREESTSLAVTASELLGGTSIEGVAAGDEAALSDARSALERIVGFGQALRITLGADSGKRYRGLESLASWSEVRTRIPNAGRKHAPRYPVDRPTTEARSHAKLSRAPLRP